MYIVKVPNIYTQCTHYKYPTYIPNVHNTSTQHISPTCISNMYSMYIQCHLGEYMYVFIFLILIQKKIIDLT